MKTIKTKEPVRIRFKELESGNKSIYLDIYVDGHRSYKFLKMYLIPETSSSAKLQNKNTLNAANAIKSQMIIDLANHEAGIKKDISKSKILFLDFIDRYEESRIKKGKRLGNVMNILKRIIIAYKGDKVQLKDVDRNFCIGLIDFMQHQYISHSRRLLQPASVKMYTSLYGSVLNLAYKEGLINENPMIYVDKPSAPEKARTFLTPDELKLLIDTPMRLMKPSDSKLAFLFSCFTGLRYSDISELKWGDIVNDGDRMSINGKIVKKTRMPIYIPLGKEALKYLPDRGNKMDSELVFKLPRDYNVQIIRWGKLAGINKHFSFHTARHTFATLSLTAGVDLYTISKLLGHKNISTTQIYAKIVNSKKDEAIDKLDSLMERNN